MAAARLASRRALTTLLTRPSARTMASSAAAAAPRKFEFLVIVPDKPGTLEKRLEVRPQHFKNMTPHVESGAWKMGGALLNSVPGDDDATKFDFMGSTLVCIAESKEAVLEQLRQDIYNTSGVWDTEKASQPPVRLQESVETAITPMIKLMSIISRRAIFVSSKVVIAAMIRPDCHSLLRWNPRCGVHAPLLETKS
ncbi:hypothetical protein PCL_05391 [Purpureocillium lilacinum]|uniref:YCII-related domain-containing protein n=1 Tax=Purpureocillium lilacinum TaxID=33203 RepID=A0A2U3DV95_PURLI|nr:hypothetical protein PCL_05391 [Purpureocillium lilacinum]